ncbi:hypothetical protein SLEP1_g39275 [Rubroshorea leprosula]|uniref:Uncharacterized protein n=1 Tax=Rubroshorea leprosula TaxID=152421 RepID=A0AAV5L032_9ROSI|nr:hypothetical protein SLEP1_g39275 [Rubroshorea leprosula]
MDGRWDQFRQAIVKHGCAEFLSRSRRTYPKEKLWNSPMSPPAWSNSSVKGVLSASTSSGTKKPGVLLNSPRRHGNQKKFTKQEWERFHSRINPNNYGRTGSNSRIH